MLPSSSTFKFVLPTLSNLTYQLEHLFVKFLHIKNHIPTLNTIWQYFTWSYSRTVHILPLITITQLVYFSQCIVFQEPLLSSISHCCSMQLSFHGHYPSGFYLINFLVKKLRWMVLPTHMHPHLYIFRHFGSSLLPNLETLYENIVFALNVLLIICFLRLKFISLIDLLNLINHKLLFLGPKLSF